MPFNGNTFTRLQSWVANAALGLKIRADLMDQDTNDIAAGLSAVAATANSAQTSVVNLADATTAGRGDALIGWSSIYTIVAGVLTRYSSLSAAVTGLGATVGTIVVRLSTTVTASLSIPATATLRIENGAVITVNAAQTLTISGICDAPNSTIFAGAGSVVFAPTSRSIDTSNWRGSPGAVFNTARAHIQNAGTPGGPVHSFEDNCTLNFTYPLAANFNAFASYDANTTITGTGDYDHYIGFQARPTYTGSGSIWSRFGGFNCLLTHSGTGAVANAYGLQVEDPLGTGPITNLYGVLVQQLDRGTNNYGFYSATPINAVSVGAGAAAEWILRGNGQTGGFGLVLQSAGDSSARVLQTANSTLRFGANNTDTMLGTADGRWKMYGPGTVATDALTSAQTLEVIGAGGATLKATGGAGNASLLAWNDTTIGNNLLIAFYTETAATLRGSIDFNRAGTAVRYNTSSDVRLKTNVVDATASGQIIDSIRIRSFDWKETGSHTEFQFVAQELFEVFPDAVREGDHGEEITDAWAVDPSKLVGLLIKEVQSLRVRVATLESKA